MSEKSENLIRSIIVTSEEELFNAINLHYGIIVIEAILSKKMASKIQLKDVGNKLSNVGILVGLFSYSILVAGIVGKVLTRDMSKYEVINMSDESITLKRKESVWEWPII